MPPVRDYLICTKSHEAIDEDEQEEPSVVSDASFVVADFTSTVDIPAGKEDISVSLDAASRSTISSLEI